MSAPTDMFRTPAGADTNESTLESLITNQANYPDRDPAKLIEAAAQISGSGIPLEKLEEHVKALMAERESLQRQIDEGRATPEGVDDDVESRKKLLEEYAQMRADMRGYGIGPEDPKRVSNVLQVLQRDNYDCAKILPDIDDRIPTWKPSASAPKLIACMASSGLVIPQILTFMNSDIHSNHSIPQYPFPYYLSLV